MISPVICISGYQTADTLMMKSIGRKKIYNKNRQHYRMCMVRGGIILVEVHMLPANEGDFLWIRYGEEKFSNILIDGGTEDIGMLFEEVLNEIDNRKEKVEALILTHIDNDHIEGALVGIANSDTELLQRVINSIWFNTCRGICTQHRDRIFNNTYAEDTLMCEIPRKALGVSQANTFLDMIEEKGLRHKLRQYICAGTECILEGGRIRIISPGEKELLKLASDWEKYEIREEKKTLSVDYERIDQIDLDDLKRKRLGSDSSVNNRSSIAFLFEYKDIRLAFMGDANAKICLDGLKQFGITHPYPVDLLKLSHHGSKYNTSDKLLKILPTSNYLLSTNGQTLRHSKTVPSKVTIAHLLKGKLSKIKPIKLISNYNWWEDAYNNKFFSINDTQKYIETGLLKIIYLDEDGIEIKEGLEVYG